MVKNSGATDLGGREFSFSLYRTSSAFVIETITNKVNAITFEGITLDTVGMHYFSVKENVNGGYSFLLEFLPEDAGKTFYYMIKENNAGRYHL